MRRVFLTIFGLVVIACGGSVQVRTPIRNDAAAASDGSMFGQDASVSADGDDQDRNIQDAERLDVESRDGDVVHSCDDLAKVAQVKFGTDAQSDRACQADTDCTVINYAGTCLNACTIIVRAADATALRLMGADLCQTFDAQGCTLVPSSCPAAPAVKCKAGVCSSAACVSSGCDPNQRCRDTCGIQDSTCC